MCTPPAGGAVAKRLSGPVCPPGGRGFVPCHPPLNPPRGTTHQAPPATAGGAFVFSGSAPTSDYHVPVLAAAGRRWAEGRRRAVGAAVGGGGHAVLLRELAADGLAFLRGPDVSAA